MEFAVLFAEEQGAKTAQRACEHFAGQKVRPARKFGKLHGPLGGVEEDGHGVALQLPGDAHQGELVPGILPDQPSFGQGGGFLSDAKKLLIEFPGGLVPAGRSPRRRALPIF